MNDMTASGRDLIRTAIRIGAITFFPEGRRLKSGRISPYFFNSGAFNSGPTIYRLAQSYTTAIVGNFMKPIGYAPMTHLYGPPYKGTILVPAISLCLWWSLHSSDIAFSSSRKEAKDHGEGGLLVGAPISAGDQVLIVDDIITDGGTKREAVEFVRSQGGEPIGLVIAFDRQEKGIDSELSAAQAFEKEFGIPVHAAATLSDMIELFQRGDVPMTNTEIDIMLPLLLAYREEYGVAR